MDSTSAQTGAADESFIQRQGGHLQVGGGTLSHTQDFMSQSIFAPQIAANAPNVRGGITWDPQTALGPTFNAASIWQTYKLNSLTIAVYFQNILEGNTLEEFSFALYIAPYNRDPLMANGSGQDINPSYLPGCQVKFFEPRTSAESGSTYTPPDQPQMLKVFTDDPKYAIPTGGTTATNAGGSVYSDGALSLDSRAGPDNTLWFCFVFDLRPFAGAIGDVRTFRFNLISKANITFEGLRWSNTNLYSVDQAQALGLNGVVTSYSIGEVEAHVESAKERGVRNRKRPRRGRADREETLAHIRAILRLLQSDAFSSSPERELLDSAAGIEESQQSPRGSDGVQEIHPEQGSPRPGAWYASGDEVEEDDRPTDGQDRVDLPSHPPRRQTKRARR